MTHLKRKALLLALAAGTLTLAGCQNLSTARSTTVMPRAWSW